MSTIAMRDLAVRLAREAGAFAVDRAATARALPKGVDGDVVTEVDQEAERRIMAGILAAYPDHAVLGEESGAHGSDDAEYRWLVDPLDGTNNYVLGLGSYGVCLTVCHHDRSVAAVVHDSVGNHSYAATIGHGAERDGVPIRMADPGPLRTATVSWMQGYAVRPEDPYRRQTFDALEQASKRVLRTWSPSIDWGLIATGKVAAMVAYRNPSWDLAGGALVACEAGAVLRASADASTVLVAHPTLIDELGELTGCLEADTVQH